MQMQATYGYRNMKCEIVADKNLSIYCSHQEDLHEDTISYAVKRFFCKSLSLCKEYVAESYNMRFGKGKKQRRSRVVAPAAAADLGYGWLVIDICVSPAGVTIKRISLLDYYPSR